MNINDRELLARTLQAEAGNQGYGGMLAAGSVIMNRANASGYGNGLRGVILKPGQFSAWNSATGYAGGEQGQDMANMQASDEAYKAADALMSGGYEDVTGGATHYYNPAISQPNWGQKAGGDWKQIGDHVFGFADADRKPNPNQAIASDTMRVLGKQPKGLLATAKATDDTESKMIPEEKPKGLLGSLGIQKMEEGAEGEVGQRFYQRDTFKDMAARMAPLLASMGSSPALQKATAGIAAQRTEKNARNKTIEYLRNNGREDLAGAVESGSLGARDAAGILFATPKEKFTQVKGSAIGLTGPQADRMFNVGSDGKITAIGGSAPVTNVYPGGKGANKFAELDAAALADVSKSAMAAGRSLGQIDRLESLLSNVETGAAASLQSLAGSFGIKTEGLGDIQAAEALISALVPQQRAPGSGPMSDADLDLFKLSLPRLINTPGGNAMILQTMRGLAQYDALGGEIVQRYRSEEITQAEAFAQLQARPDPFAQFRQVVGAPEGGAGIGRDEATKLLLGNGGKN